MDGKKRRKKKKKTHENLRVLFGVCGFPLVYDLFEQVKLKNCVRFFVLFSELKWLSSTTGHTFRRFYEYVESIRFACDDGLQRTTSKTFEDYLID